MEIPHLVREHLGDETIEATVSLGDEDVVCVTPTRVLVYRGEGLLSDESVDSYSLNLERLDISEGRRKTKFIMEYIDGEETFTVPGSRADSILKLMLQGAFRVSGVIDDDESVAGVYPFSELTLVVSDGRLVKHIGESVWDEDYEVYDYDDVTDLDFEEGSVATQIVITVDGRPQRIKAPNDEAPQVRQTLVQTLCTHYDVGSLEELQNVMKSDTSASAESQSSADGFGLDDGISPLVDDGESSGESTADGDPLGASQSQSTETTSSSATTSAESTSSKSTTGTETRQTKAKSETPTQTTEAETVPSQNAAIDPEEIEEIQDQLSRLTAVVKRQNKLLEHYDERIEDHDERIEQLIEELRRGR